MLPVPFATIAIVQAQTQTITIKPIDFETWDNAKLYDYATKLLKAGRRFQSAMDALTIAVRRDPKNLDYQLALGCACASRFASYGEALNSDSDYLQKRYDKLKSEWDKAQEDSTDVDFGTPPPILPVPTTTPDDARPLLLTQQEIHKAMLTLGKQALIAFDAAHQLQAGREAEKQAESENIEGWALFLLWRYGKAVMQGGVVTARTSLTRLEDRNFNVVPKDFLTYFRHCTEHDATKAEYWHSLALSVVPDYVDPKRNSNSNDAFDYKANDVVEANTAFAKSLSIKKNNFDVLYQKAIINLKYSPSEAESLFEQCANQRSTNAALWYLVALQQFGRAKTQKEPVLEQLQEKALATVERGNKAPLYYPVPLMIPAPPLLKKAWEFAPVYGRVSDIQIVLGIFNLVGKMEVKNLPENDLLGVRCASTILTMGLRLLTIPPLQDVVALEPSYRTALQNRLTYAIITAQVAYQKVQEAQAIKPSEPKSVFLSTYDDTMRQLETVERRISRLF